jgi:hypothetical protein
MSAVVLDNSIAGNPTPNSSILTANGARFGGGGVVSSGPINAGQGNTAQGSVFYGSLTVADDAPAAPAVVQPSYFTTYASATTGGGLGANQLQKFAYADPRVSGPSTIQEYEAGGWVATATTFVAPALAVNAAFINRPQWQTRPLTEGDFVGSFTCAATPVVVPCAGITNNARVRIMLVGGDAAAFTAAALGGAAVPTISITVGATTAASTFTVSGGEAGMIYNYEVLLG